MRLGLVAPTSSKKGPRSEHPARSGRVSKVGTFLGASVVVQDDTSVERRVA